MELDEFDGEVEEPEANLIDQVTDEMEYLHQMIDREYERIEFKQIQIEDFNEASFEQDIEQDIEQHIEGEIDQAEVEASDIEESDIQESDIQEREERGSQKYQLSLVLTTSSTLSLPLMLTEYPMLPYLTLYLAVTISLSCSSTLLHCLS